MISLAAVAERWASSRTSWATTAKAAAGLAGAGRLDAGVQCQQIGLEGDLVDHADNAAGSWPRHPRCGSWRRRRGPRPRPRRGRRRRSGWLACPVVRRPVRRGANGGRDLVDGRRRSPQARPPAARCGAPDLSAAGAEVAGIVTDRAGIVADVLHGVAQCGRWTR